MGKRSIVVVQPEKENGDIEYKRLVHQARPDRLRSLATQMAYRMDEGNGICHYRIGVEDNGCHSLLNLEEMIESIRFLEYIARSLNSVVVERTFIQNEIEE